MSEDPKPATGGRPAEDSGIDGPDSDVAGPAPGAIGSGGARPDLDEAVEAWSSMGDSSLLRGVAAVILGFLLLTLGSRLATGAVISFTGIGPDDPLTPGFMGASLGSKLLVSLAAGWLTARAAPRAPRVHAIALAAVLTFFTLATAAGMASSGQLDTGWFIKAGWIIGPVGIVLGGSLRSSPR